jgi:hypothetical protein
MPNLWRDQMLSRLDMEELAVEVSRKQTPGMAFATPQPGGRPEKVKARRLILKWLTQDRRPKGLSIVTMPGLRWEFERELLMMREGPSNNRRNKVHRTYICGIEGDEAIYRAALAHIPGASGPDGKINQLTKLGSATCSVRTPMIVRYHRCWFEDFAYEPGPPEDAAWFDFNGPLSIKRLEALKTFWSTRIRWALWITVLNARYEEAVGNLLKGHSNAAHFLKQHLGAREMIDPWFYGDTSPMMQVGFLK